MFVKCFAGAIVGIRAVGVTVEVNVAGGGIGMYLVGLPDNAVKESEQRIRAAFENSSRRMTGKKVVVNLAPADLRKEGSGFDLPIAVGILAATEQVVSDKLADTMFVGELSLDGGVKPARGVLPLAVMAKEQGLSLNPVKISGTCGRLMCCLKYEQDAYEHLLRHTPKVGAFVETREGRGTVIENNLITGILKVRLDRRPDAAPLVVDRHEVKLLKDAKIQVDKSEIEALKGIE